MAGTPDDALRLRQALAKELVGPPRAPVPTASVGALETLQRELAQIEQQMQMVGGTSAQDQLLQQALIRRALALQDQIEQARAPTATVELDELKELPGTAALGASTLGASALGAPPAAAPPAAAAAAPARAPQKTQEGQMMAQAGIPDPESMFEALKAHTAEA